MSEQRAQLKNTKKETEKKKLLSIHQQRKLSRKIKSFRRDKQRTATIMVYKKNEEGTTEECFRKDEVEEACIEENVARFTQNINTPFLMEPLVSEIGLLAETEAANNILKGEYQVPEQLDEYTKALIKELKLPEGIPITGAIPNTVTPEDNKNAWESQKEKVSSQGLHFGHTKACSSHPHLNNFDAQVRSLPYKHGFAPEAWKKITDVEILKSEGVLEIERMRTMQLLDSMFNMNNKKLGRELMKKAEEEGLIAEEQFGSRKAHKAVSVALNKRLTLDLLRQKKKAGVIISNDAKSCYDRVAHNVAILSMRRWGAPKSTVTSLFKTFQQATHNVRTAFGDSTRTYDSKSGAIPLQGIAQGNGCAPTGWVCISTPLINILKAAKFGAFLLSAITVTAIYFACYAFVDDTDLVHTAQHNEFVGEEMIPTIQNLMDTWQGSLRATGGAINPKKTYWTFVDFKWHRNKWTLVSDTDVP